MSQQYLRRLEDSAKAVGEFFQSYPEEQINKEIIPGKWTAGQHLHHLTVSTKALRKALTYPRWLLRYKFGRMNRPERDYDSLLSRYEEKLQLSAGHQPDKRFDPGQIEHIEIEKLLDEFRRESKSLIGNASKWKEASLSQHILPHPLLGKLSVREMLLFTALHNRHHLKILEKKYR